MIHQENETVNAINRFQELTFANFATNNTIGYDSFVTLQTNAIHCRDVRSRVTNELFERPSVKIRVRCFQKNMPHLHLDSKHAVRKFITITLRIPYCTWHPALQNKNPLAE
jgi:hypothetical protein